MSQVRICRFGRFAMFAATVALATRAGANNVARPTELFHIDATAE